MSNKPPFSISPYILELLQQIHRELGYLEGAKLTVPRIFLRRVNAIKTIQSSLAIEGNSLNIQQVTAILENKPVIAPQKDITEVQNAINVYKKLDNFDALSIDSFLNAHDIMMNSLIKDSGRWRQQGVGIFKGSKITHIAPGAKRVAELMQQLFKFIAEDKDTPWLIKACVFHYELEFIHPFSDGNGRMGRLWQQLILMKENIIFKYLPIEVIIKNHQQDYYEVLAKCDRLGDSTLFIEFMLEKILSMLNIYSNDAIIDNTPASRLTFAKNHFENKTFSRKDYTILHKNISTSTASRDLASGLSNGKLQATGSGNQTLYKFVDNKNVDLI